MTFERWLPRTDYSRQEQVLRRRLTRTGKLFGFLRDCRRELFSDDFQAELESMYRDTGAGRDPVPPALLVMATLLQAYEGMSDAEAAEMTVVDLRWQMVLDRLGCEDPGIRPRHAGRLSRACSSDRNGDVCRPVHRWKEE